MVLMIPTSPMMKATRAFCYGYELPDELKPRQDASRTAEEVEKVDNGFRISKKSPPFRPVRLCAKQEIEKLRVEAQKLENELSALRMKCGYEDRVFNELTLKAARQRHKADTMKSECRNRRLKLLTGAVLRLMQRLKASRQRQVRLRSVVAHKRFYEITNSNPLADAVAFHDLLEAVDQLQFDMRGIYARFGINRIEEVHAEVRTECFSSCGARVEGIDCRTLPFDLKSVSESIWHFLAHGENPVQPRPLTNGETMTRMYSVDALLCGLKSTHTARDILRRVSTKDHVVILWASVWQKESNAMGMPVAHGALHREGFVSLRRSDMGDLLLHTFYRIRVEPCGDLDCVRNPSIESMGCPLHSAAAVVQNEIARWIDGMEMRLLQSNAAMLSETSTQRTPSPECSW